MELLRKSLFGVAAGFWLVAGALATFGVLDFGLAGGARLLGVLMLANGAALGLAWRFSLRGHRLADYAALAVVGVNALLSLTDEVGPLDLLSLLINGALLALLIAGMRRRGTDNEPPGASNSSATNTTTTDY